MKITRLKLEQLRRFRRPVEFAGLAPGLNLFVGPNEAGKSTVVAALRAAFLERHRSTSIDDLRPWDDAAARPTVEVDFECGGVAHRLVKSFLQRPRCELYVGATGRRLEGTAAEDHLADLLGFEFAKKGGSRPEHWGIPGLLWVRQGAGHDLRDAVQHAAGGLRGALDASVGELATSDGDEVIDDVRRERDTLLTPHKRQPTGAYKEAIDAAAALDADVRALDDRVQAWRGRVDRLAVLRRDAADDEAAAPWQALRAQEADARRKLDELTAADRALDADRRRLAELDARLVLLRGELDAFDRQAEALAQRDATLAAARAVLDDAAATLARCRLAQQAADAGWQRARAALAAARGADERARLLRERDELARQAAAAQAALATARGYHERHLAERRRLAETPPIPEKDLAALRRDDATLREIALRRQAVATRLRFDLTPGTRLDVTGDDGTPLEARGERLLAAPATIDLAGLGRLQIVPGGDDLKTLARDHDRLADAQAARLQRLGVASLDAAEARQRAHDEAAAACKQAADALTIVAPAGLDALHAEVQRLAARQDEVRRAVERLAAASRVPAEDPADADEDALALAGAEAQADGAAGATGNVRATGVATARAAPVATAARIAHALPAPRAVPILDAGLSAKPGGPATVSADADLQAAAAFDPPPSLADATQAEDTARTALERATRHLATAREAHAVAAAAHDAALREQAAAHAALHAPGRAERHRQVAVQRTDALAERATLADRIDAETRRLAAARPDLLRQDVERFARSARLAEDAQRDRRDEMLKLEAALAAAGADGIEETLATRQRELDAAERRRDELARRAAALDWLLTRLTARRDALVRRLHAPLQRRLDHYLPLLFPGGRLDVEEGLTLGRLTRTAAGGGSGIEAGAVEEMSFGAREQIGIVGRLAYADLLKEAGRPTLLILDDALVHSDAERLGQMKRVLFDAAQRHQILVFTCHPQQWRDLGVPVRRVEAMRAD